MSSEKKPATLSDINSLTYEEIMLYKRTILWVNIILGIIGGVTTCLSIEMIMEYTTHYIILTLLGSTSVAMLLLILGVSSVNDVLTARIRSHFSDRIDE